MELMHQGCCVSPNRSQQAAARRPHPAPMPLPGPHTTPQPLGAGAPRAPRPARVGEGKELQPGPSCNTQPTLFLFPVARFGSPATCSVLASVAARTVFDAMRGNSTLLGRISFNPALSQYPVLSHLKYK